MNVISSSFQLGVAQADGRVPVIEAHVMSDGHVMRFEYLKDSSVDPALVMNNRKDYINEKLAADDVANAVARSVKVPIPKYDFRHLFTEAERTLIDDFNNGGYLTDNRLTAAQKDKIALALADYEVTDFIHLDNPDTIAVITMFEALGFIASGRAQVILNG